MMKIPFVHFIPNHSSHNEKQQDQITMNEITVFNFILVTISCFHSHFVSHEVVRAHFQVKNRIIFSFLINQRRTNLDQHCLLHRLFPSSSLSSPSSAHQALLLRLVRTRTAVDEILRSGRYRIVSLESL